MSSEPPSRIQPKGISHETKSAQEEVASSRKVEKVQKIDDVDADERARQRNKFRAMMGDDDQAEDLDSTKWPSPFDVITGKTTESQPPSVFGTPAPTGAPTPSSSYGDADDGIIASPSYTPPPNLDTPLPDDTEAETTTNSLPLAKEFWNNVGLPDHPLPDQTLQETSQSAARAGGKGASGQLGGKKRENRSGRK